MEYSIEELEAFEETVLERIYSLEARLTELEDEMGSGHEQSEISARIDALKDKYAAINLKIREASESDDDDDADADADEGDFDD
jgi:uncharacterized coiled-coil DUF342 family protein